MALSYAHGAIQWANADPVSTVYTVSGLSFQPKALRFYTNGIFSATDAVDTASNLNRGMGFAVSTSSRRAVTTFDNDANAAADCGTLMRDDCVICTVNGSAGSGGQLDLNSITSDGFTLIVDVTTISANVTVFWEAWGGTDITAAVVGDFSEPAATGNVDYTATGLTAGGTDQIVFFAGTQSSSAANTAEANDAGMYYGVAKNDTQQFVAAVNSDDASATMDTNRYGRVGDCVAMSLIGGGNPDARAQFVQYNTDGFRLNWSSRAVTGRKSIFMAIKGGQWAAGGTAINETSAAATATVSGLPFQPIGITLVSHHNTESTPGTAQGGAVLGIGTATSTTSRRTLGSADRDGQANVDIQLVVQYDQVLAFPLADGTLGATIDLNAFNSDGFQLIVDDADATGVTSMWVGYVAFASAAAAAGHPAMRRLGGFQGARPVNIGRLGRVGQVF